MCHLLELQATLDESNPFDSQKFPMKGHSWHPVPLLVHSKRALPVEQASSTERGFIYGNIGTVRGDDLMPLLLAHVDRLDKFGA